MYGAILGDIIGSPYEFDSHNIKTKEFDLFSDRSEFTDDSIMTLAVADALMKAGTDASDDVLRAALVESMQTIGRRYPFAGYGVSFSAWLYDDAPKPYQSYGNGSAMRVSAIPWLIQDDFARMLHVARLSAEVTHNHPEGIKGAVSVAAAIFLALHGKDKEFIRKYITDHYKYDLTRTCDQIRPDYHHVESCQETVPEAMTAFLEGKDFEDVIRTAVSLGGDSDTLTCIAGSMAEAVYGVPEDLKATCRDMLTSDLLEILNRFDEKVEADRKARETDPVRKARWEQALHPAGPAPMPGKMKAVGNEPLEERIRAWNRDRSQTNYAGLVGTVASRCAENARVLVPVRPLPSQEEGKPRFQLQLMKSPADNKFWQPVFTSEAQLMKTGSKQGAVLSMPLRDILQRVAESEKGQTSVAGIVLNPSDRETSVPLSIVNAANSALTPGGGVCGAIHAAAGPELARECARIGGCNTGSAVITGGYRLEAKYVIHAVGPVYHGTADDSLLLASAYTSSLDLAREKGLHSIAFPAISTGIYGYPRQEAAGIALKAVTGWIQKNASYGMTVFMVAYDQETFDIFQKMMPKKKA